MNKESVLKYLLLNRQKVVSGGVVAKELNVSRTAVWKMINQLKSEGFPIISVANEGYMIEKDADILCKTGMELLLENRVLLAGIEVLDQVDSTNNYLKQKASQNYPDRYVVVAQEQDSGRGRMQRNFFSPKGQGVYVSILLRPKMHLSKINFLTILTALAVYDAIFECSGIKTGIKWPNDILLDQKKLCGILTEAGIEGESGNVDYAVVGMGMNLKQRLDDFPPEIQEIATSIYAGSGKEVFRDEFCASFISYFFAYYDSYILGEKQEILQVYKERLCMLGQEIRVLGQNESYIGEAFDIDEEARLMVRKKNGDIATLFAGEISIRNL